MQASIWSTLPGPMPIVASITQLAPSIAQDGRAIGPGV
jgi:hypothetical protein